MELPVVLPVKNFDSKYCIRVLFASLFLTCFMGSFLQKFFIKMFMIYTIESVDCNMAIVLRFIAEIHELPVSVKFDFILLPTRLQRATCSIHLVASHCCPWTRATVLSSRNMYQVPYMCTQLSVIIFSIISLTDGFSLTRRDHLTV